jgi:hypothetical protein
MDDAGAGLRSLGSGSIARVVVDDHDFIDDGGKCEVLNRGADVRRLVVSWKHDTDAL